MVCTPERASLRVGQAGKERACVPDRAGFAQCHRIDPRYVSLDAETLTKAGRFINYKEKIMAKFRDFVARQLPVTKVRRGSGVRAGSSLFSAKHTIGS
jgi:hypothetical protein